MEFKRSAGILLHPTSLPGKYGIGDLGENAYAFVDFLVHAGQTLWQMFPLGPTGYGDSPYQCFSAFAGNPYLISPDLLNKDGLLTDDELSNIPEFNPNYIDYGKLIEYKVGLLKTAYGNYKNNGSNFDDEINKFNDEQKVWLNDYALFMACKDYHGGKVWAEWEDEIAYREPGAVEKWTEKLADDVKYQKFIQYLFFKQWRDVKAYANSKGIQIIGDLPIFVAYDSSEVWANKSVFTVDEKGNKETVAGVPPDYFSATGQLWGNPLYKWEVMETDGFAWWKRRFSQMFELFDIVRIDHFRGFDAYYEIPGDAKTAEKGEWKPSPGYKLFDAIKNDLGDVPIIAEDLGVITDSVEALRDHYNFPGMKILQFAYGPEGDKGFLPHNFVKNCVAYPGSHDNDTTRGFFDKAKDNDPDIYQWAQKYMNYYGEDMCYQVIREAYASVAVIAVVSMQDVLNLGSDARMNFPGTLGGNWSWRFRWDQVSEELADKYKEMTILYERTPAENENNNE